MEDPARKYRPIRWCRYIERLGDIVMKITAARKGGIEVQMMEDLLAEASQVSYNLYSQILHRVLLFTPVNELKDIIDDFEEEVYGDE